MLPESHELHIPTHETDYRDWKLDQPPVKMVEYANFLADVLTRLTTDADAEVGRWKEFLVKSSQLQPTDRARVYNPLEAVIATEAERAVAIRCVADTAQYNRPDTEFADAARARPV